MCRRFGTGRAGIGWFGILPDGSSKAKTRVGVRDLCKNSDDYDGLRVLSWTTWEVST